MPERTTEDILQQIKRVTMTRQRIAEILKEEFGKEVDFKENEDWSWSSPKYLDKPCPQCNSQENLICLHATRVDREYPDYYYLYYRICLDCGNIELHSDSKIDVDKEELLFGASSECPFCRGA
ncbi:MAG: hypothetical protein ACE5NG_08155 [bacterium]